MGRFGTIWVSPTAWVWSFTNEKTFNWGKKDPFTDWAAIHFYIQHFYIQVFLFNVGMYNTPNSAQFFKLDTRMFDPQINRSAPPGCLSACFPSPRSHDSTHPTASPVTLSICHSPALCTSPPLSFCSPSLQSGCYLYTLKKKKKKSQCSAPLPLWLDVLLQLTRGWIHKSGKGQLSELQSWAPHISYSLGDLLRALHQICLSSRLARRHTFLLLLLWAFVVSVHLFRLPYSSSSFLLHLS